MSKTIQLYIEGLRCQGCANRLTKELMNKQGVNSALVNFAAEEALVEIDDKILTPEALSQFITSVGFNAILPKLNEERQDNHKKELYKLITLWLLSLPFWYGMLHMLGFSALKPVPITFQLVLALIIQIYFGYKFYVSAYASIKSNSLNMDVLVSLGTSCALLYSIINLFVYKDLTNLYFESSVMVLAFISLGKYIESRAKKNSLNDMQKLINLTPKTAQILRDNVFVELALNEVKLKDIAKVNIGDRVGADGVILKGSAYLDQSHLTGESIPVLLTVGDKIIAGSMVVEGSIEFEINALGGKTLLGDMLKKLNQAMQEKAQIARLADKIANIFVPVVLIIALITFTINYFVLHDFTPAILRAVAVLVIACPCALGLATPAAIIVGLGLGAKHGVWFKNPQSLENLHAIGHICFDKTGTLTVGKPKVNQIYSTNFADSLSPQLSLYNLANLIEDKSSHPLAKAIVSYCQDKITEHNLSIKTLNNTIGKGLEAVVVAGSDSFNVRVGSADFCQLESSEFPKNELNRWQQQSFSTVFLSLEHAGKFNLVGAFALSDTIREDSLLSLENIRKLGISTYLLSGDNQNIAHNIGAKLGFTSDQIHGNMLPDDKAKFIKKLQDLGGKVAMIGDGINDSLALSTANSSLSVHSATEVANNSADVNILKNSSEPVYSAIWIAKATVRNIKQNLFFAFIYNIIGIPLAAFGILNPVIASIFMALSSISVVSNAIRLKFKQAPF